MRWKKRETVSLKFPIGRSVEEVFQALKQEGLQPVMSDYVRV